MDGSAFRHLPHAIGCLVLLGVLLGVAVGFVFALWLT